MAKFDENSRVKIPAIVHATKLGYKYLSYKENKDRLDSDNNIVVPIFKKQFLNLNPESNEEDFGRLQ